MIRRIALFATILVFVAWGRKGHEIVGSIAQQLLTADARTAVDKLLDDATLNEKTNLHMSSSSSMTSGSAELSP